MKTYLCLNSVDCLDARYTCMFHMFGESWVLPIKFWCLFLLIKFSLCLEKSWKACSSSVLYMLFFDAFGQNKMNESFSVSSTFSLWSWFGLWRICILHILSVYSFPLLYRFFFHLNKTMKPKEKMIIQHAVLSNLYCLEPVRQQKKLESYLIV